MPSFFLFASSYKMSASAVYVLDVKGKVGEHNKKISTMYI